MPGILNHSPAHVTARLLVQLRLGLTPVVGNTIEPWQVYVSDEPNQPDNVITVMDAVERNDGRLMVGGEQQVHHGISVRVRSRRHEDGWEKANAIGMGLSRILRKTIAIDAHTYLIQCYSLIKTSALGRIKQEEGKASRLAFTVGALVSVRKVVAVVA